MSKIITPEQTGIKKETALLLVFVSLVVGFIGGVVFSAYKFDPQVNMSAAMPPHNHGNADHIAKLEETLQADANNAPAWIDLGNHYFEAQKFDKAISAYQSALKVTPGNADVWTDLGVMYRRKKQPKEALAAFQKAQSLDSSHEVSLFNAGVVLMHDLNRPEEAKATWKKLIAINPVAKTPSGQSVKALIDKMP